MVSICDGKDNRQAHSEKNLHSYAGEEEFTKMQMVPSRSVTLRKICTCIQSSIHGCTIDRALYYAIVYKKIISARAVCDISPAIAREKKTITRKKNKYTFSTAHCYPDTGTKLGVQQH